MNNKINKQSQWYGDLPERWKVHSLKTFLREHTVKNQPELQMLSVERERGVIVRQTNGSSTNHNIIPEDLSGYKVVSANQFVMNKMKAWQGSYGVSKHNGIVSPAYFVFDLVFENPNFFNIALRSRAYIGEFARFSKGIRVDQWDFDISRLRDIAFAFPPLPEQTQIVRFLDWKVSRINKLINAKRRQIELLKEQKQNLISVELTGEKIPLKRLLVEPLQYGANASGVPFEENLPHYIRITDISLDGKLKSENSKSLPKEEAINYLLKDGDILLARSGATAGKAFIYESKYGLCAFAGYLIRANVKEKLLFPKYFFYYTQSNDYEQWKNSIFIQATIQNISAERYNYLPIPVPTLSEQKSIVAELDIRCADINRLIGKLQEEIALFTEYRTRLISDVVTGKMDVRGVIVPEYENIEETNNNQQDSIAADDVESSREED